MDLKSKKLIVAIVASVLGFAGVYLDFSVAEIAMIVGPLGMYPLGQGLADFGKEAEKIKAQIT